MLWIAVQHTFLKYSCSLKFGTVSRCSFHWQCCTLCEKDEKVAPCNVSIAIPLPSASLLATISLVLSISNFVQIGFIYEHLDELYKWSFWYEKQISNLLWWSFRFGEWEGVWEVLHTHLPLFNHLKTTVFKDMPFEVWAHSAARKLNNLVKA